MPSAQVLNYGQAAFEGMKAQESVKGRIVLFRPDKNAERIKAGALRLSMPPVPEAQFVSAVQSLVSANKDWVSSPFKCDVSHITYGRWLVPPRDDPH